MHEINHPLHPLVSLLFFKGMADILTQYSEFVAHT